MQWTRWLRQQVPADTTVVLNFDETALERQIARRHGAVLGVGRAWQDLAMHERAGRRETHGHLTLAAAVCADATLQPHLPQLLLPKDATLTRAEKARLEALAPPVAWQADG